MKRTILGLVLALSLMNAAMALDEPDIAAKSNSEIETSATGLNPGALYVLAGRLLAEGNGQAAAGWMYAGRLRYLFLLQAGNGRPETEYASFLAIDNQIGRQVEAFIAKDPRARIEAIDWALQWDEASENLVTSKTDHSDLLGKIRASFIELRNSLRAQYDADHGN
ncbi:hypothetical protein FPY71_17585 [Aureimonas fodinaquatilis]|uniref:Uncharacterized protein n=1 Tax=Aureimonas fodinaquatilis TaxID=2565783 RepID=A0A5B0DQ48_9HYPH|nr:hypothetical protein [Aureimonas fodinaquatilis]KAA0968142.1 hypothetical protein FPY71_17585 [Aureimonas fodinaquatilis]